MQFGSFIDDKRGVPRDRVHFFRTFWGGFSFSSAPTAMAWTAFLRRSAAGHHKTLSGKTKTVRARSDLRVDS